MFKFCFLMVSTLLLGLPISVHNQHEIYTTGKEFIATGLNYADEGLIQAGHQLPSIAEI